MDINRRLCNVSVFLLFFIMFLVQTSYSANDTTVPSRDNFLPVGWESMCIVENGAQNDVYFRCSVDNQNSGKWRLDTLKDWIGSSNFSYHFDVHCTDQSNVSIPWPIKAENLVSLKVTKCFILNFLENPSFDKSYPEVSDQLISLQLIDCVIVLDIWELMNYMMNIENLSKDFICGHEETIVEIVMRNISYDFLDNFFEDDSANSANDTMDNQILDVGKKFIEDNRKIKYKCDFKKLKYVDQSISSSKSKYHVDLITENALYNEVRVFNISHTRQTIINSRFKEWWIYFPKLEVLDLSYNYISTFELDSTAIAWDTPLLRIDLSHNNFTRITSDFIHQLAGIKNLKIVLEGNPFRCGCSPEMKKLANFIQSRENWKNSGYSPYQDIRLLKCATPESARGKSLISLTQSDMSCVMTSNAPIIILSVLVVFLLVVIIIITRYRREIQILTYTRFHVILPCQPHERFQEKTFDAFVSYSTDDETWVNKTFQALEEEEEEEHKKGHSFRFCLHQRDFIAGKTIFDNVIESVEASRHTIIILSKNFLKSHWCLYEFHEAFQQSIMERKRHLLVVVLEDIPEEDLPKELKRCLKTFTYIRKDDTIFLDRLIYALSFKGHKTVCDKENVNKLVTLPQQPEAIKLDPDSIKCYNNLALEADEIPKNMSDLNPDSTKGYTDLVLGKDVESKKLSELYV